MREATVRAVGANPRGLPPNRPGDHQQRPGANGPAEHTRRDPHSRRATAKGVLAVIYGEPDTSRFLAAVQRLKKQQRKRERMTRQAKQRVRAALRKMRAS